MSSAFRPLPWASATNIYEVNIRQYTYEGTFAAFARHLPRLAGMGVEVLWFMPITPIGIPKRLGTLGSYYACSSYVEVNPEFGSLEDFVELVREAHQHGLKVIIDWVANHTGYGHQWMEEHPEYYLQDATGHFVERNGWTDVVDLNFDHAPMREAMISAMKFWIDKADIDGFRCDMAHLVPLNFWQQARTALDPVKPLFWLAECEVPAYHAVFDASYAWAWMHESASFASDGKSITVLDKVLYQYQFDYPAHALKLFFTTNHDENSWNGTEYEKYGDLAALFAVLSFTWNGLPLVYSGQEIPNTRRLAFFDKDELKWPEKPALEEFYKTLMHLRKQNAALRGGWENSGTIRLNLGNERVLAYERHQGNQKVLVVLNFTEHRQSLALNDERIEGSYRDVFTGQQHNFDMTRHLSLEPFAYLVLEQ